MVESGIVMHCGQHRLKWHTWPGMLWGTKGCGGPIHSIKNCQRQVIMIIKPLFASLNGQEGLLDTMSNIIFLVGMLAFF